MIRRRIGGIDGRVSDDKSLAGIHASLESDTTPNTACLSRRPYK